MIKYFNCILAVLIFLNTILMQSSYAEMKMSTSVVTLKNTLSNKFILEFSQPSINIENCFVPEYGKGVRITSSDENLVHAPFGTPDVPRIITKIRIPEKGKATLVITSVEKEILGTLKVVPCQSPDKISGKKSNYIINEDVYSSATLFPQQEVSLIDCEILRDIRIAVIQFNPVQVNPVTGEVVIVKKVHVSLNFDSMRGHNELSINDKSITRSFIPMYEDVLNVNTNTMRTSIMQDDVPCYVFLGDDETLAAIDEFVKWKIRKGLKVHVANVDSIGKTSNQIDSWIEKIYGQWSPKPEYILFVGDEKVIKPPTVKYNNATYETDNKFGVIGSGHVPSIHTGRISPKNGNASNLTYQTWKIRMHEMDPLDGEWLGKGAAFGCKDNTGPKCAQKMIETFKSAGLKAEKYVEGESSFISGQKFVNIFEEGLSVFSMTGHGLQTQWATAKMKNQDVANMKNGRMWPFITNVACLNSDYVGRYCFAEAWMAEGSVEDPKGCVAMISSTPSASMGALPMLQGIMDCLLKDDMRHTGAALTYGKSRIDRGSLYDLYGFIHWGCPEIDIIPAPNGLEELEVIHQDPRPGNNKIVVKKNGTGVEGALVSVVTINYEPLGSGYTDGSGEISFDLPQFNDSTFVTVTYRSCKPYLKTCVQAGVFIITSPEANALFDINENVQLKWETDGDPVDKVKIEYTVDGGLAYTVIESSINNSEQYDWTTPAVMGSDNCFFRITDIDNSTRYSRSNNFRVWDISDVEGEAIGADKPEIYYNGPISGTIEANAQGAFALKKLYPGDYKIWVQPQI